MKIAIRFALILASAMFAANLIRFDLIGIEHAFIRNYSGMLPVLILIVGLYFGIRKNREVNYKGEMNYGQALYFGIILSAFAGLFLGILHMFYYQFINTSYADRVIKAYTPLFVEMKLKPQEIQTQIQGIRNTFKPMSQLTESFVITLLMGIVFTSVLSAFLRTKDTFTQIFKPKE
ncbi:MAG TPA: DUF4199 domain-containing protein [Cytophagaceae bacterium]|nr:DUF4199 domain-containing protein [Cytophagaceae bacterium]